MNPIISGKKEKTKPFLVFAMISMYISSILLFVIIIKSLLKNESLFSGFSFFNEKIDVIDCLSSSISFFFSSIFLDLEIEVEK